ncbi:MAG: TIGR03960 family B12-binding radical SAM protein [Synechococcales cyanobacterium RM1_1_8]|nr:TIGR03960 family B12-binding radical SAM protein [Synechococcales cyanobacterium RM1_1_8]
MAVSVDSLLNAAVNRPARYLGNERGAIHKPWDSANIRWALTYPEIYEVGSSNLGHIILYNIINAQPRQLCDRAYLPAADLSAKLRETDTPLFGVESRRSLNTFDILGFSLSYELGATNILDMLSLCQVDLTWAERTAADKSPWQGGAPFIFAGGQTATSNPEPYAEFFDFVALGDGEELLPEIALVLDEAKEAGLGREATLLDLAQVPGCYVPRFYDMAQDGSVHPNRPQVPARVLRRVATPIPAYAIGLVPYIETVHDRLTVEIRRGCTRGCRFCQPGMLTRPARDVEPEAVVDAIEKGMRATGYNEFSLLSLSCSDYLALPAVGVEVKNRLKTENISLSLPSQRVDRFDENIAHIMGGTRKTGITFAPEAGTQRMRDIVNKGLTNEELLRGIKTAYNQGWEKIKLYFMIGLPGELDADVLGIAETVRWLQQECRGRKRKISFNITISNFTPKPHTPFQWHSVSTQEFRRKQRLLREEFNTLRNVKVNFTDVRISAMEDFVGRGDRRLAPVVRRAWELGAGMDSWWESLDNAYAAWAQAIDEAGLSWKYRQVESGEWNIFDEPDRSRSEAEVVADSDRLAKQLDAPLPWDHLDTGIDKQWLKDDLFKALEAATVPDCSFEGCSHCGVCGLDFGHNVVVPPLQIPKIQRTSKPDSSRAQRLRIRFGKQGSMTLISHLDLVRLFDRALRRASLPISFTGGFHPGPRIAPANALPLGMGSSAELMDLELTRPMDPEDFRAQLTAQLPPELPIYGIEDIDLKSPSVTQRLSAAAYVLWVEVLWGEESLPLADRARADSPWQPWIAALLAADQVPLEKTSKSGKVQVFNGRDRLHHLELAPELAVERGWNLEPHQTVLYYKGSCRNDGTLLRPEQLLTLLETIARRNAPPQQNGSAAPSLQLLQAHRSQLWLDPVVEATASAPASRSLAIAGDRPHHPGTLIKAAAFHPATPFPLALPEPPRE